MILRRLRVPPIAWVLSGAVALALLALDARLVRVSGHEQFFHDGDSNFYLVTARDIFGRGLAYTRGGAAAEAPYRYGRIGLPFIAWLLAFGQPRLIDWSLIGVYLVSIAAIPAIAATLLSEYGAPPAGAAVVLVVPGGLLLYGLVYAEPLLIALLLLACLFEARDRPRWALAALAYAVLVKEIAVLAVGIWLVRAARRREMSQVLACAAALVPYALWSTWVRVRIGQFPILAETPSRRDAFGLPGVGIVHVAGGTSPNHAFIVAMTVTTIALGIAGAWVARSYRIGAMTAVFTALTACLGPGALYYVAENARLLTVPQTFAVLGLVVGLAHRHDRVAAPRRSTDETNPDATR